MDMFVFFRGTSGNGGQCNLFAGLDRSCNLKDVPFYQAKKEDY